MQYIIPILVNCSPLRNSVVVDILINITGGVGQQLFPIGRAIKLVKCGSKIVNATNPLTIAAKITLTIVESSS